MATTAFGEKFASNEVGYNPINAYLLCYLATSVYADQIVHLDGSLKTARSVAARSDALQRNPATFGAEFEARLKGFFPRATTFRFHSTRVNADGWDAEAAVIDSPAAVFIVVRGTDRVGSEPSQFKYDWREWYGTDFDFGTMSPGNGVTGMVHKGFWMSLRENIRSDIHAQVSRILRGAPGKKVWITGHSLGGAQAQLLAAFLRANSIPVQGVYTFASPRVGNPDFATWLSSALGPGGTRLQRFDFGEDLITMVPMDFIGYGAAGQRNWYKDVRSFERDTREWAPRPPGCFCHHHQAWYLQSAWKQLDAGARAGLPSPDPFGIPTKDSEGCTTLDVNRALSASWVENATQETVETIAWNAAQLLGNLTGTVIEEGIYYIRCAKGMKYLDIPGSTAGEDGSKLQLWDLGESAKNNKFRIVRETPYYRIETLYDVRPTRTTKETLVVEAQAESLLKPTTRAQTWRRNLVPALNQNQKWLFFRVPGSPTNRYVIYNAAALKVLDAEASTAATNGGGVSLRAAVSNDPTQVWVLQKAPR